MGFFSDLFKNKIEKLKRGDVVDSICELEKQQDKIVDEISDLDVKMNDIKSRALKEKNQQVKLAYVKKYNSINNEKTQKAKRMQLLQANLDNMEKLKLLIDDNEFLKDNSNLTINQVLTNPTVLEKALNKMYGKKTIHEEGIVSSREVFDSVESAFGENDDIYGIDEDASAVLAMFEMENSNDESMAFFENEDDVKIKENDGRKINNN